MPNNSVPLAVIGALTVSVWFAGVTGPTSRAAEFEGAPYVTRSGTVTFQFDRASSEALGLRFIARGQSPNAPLLGQGAYVFDLEASSTLEVEGDAGVFGRIVGGVLRTRGALMLDRPGGRVVIGNLTIEVGSDGVFVVRSMLDNRAASNATFRLDSVMLDFREAALSLRLIGEVSLAEPLAEALDTPASTGAVIGTVVIEAGMEPRGAYRPTAEAHAIDTASQSAVGRGGPGVPDILVADLPAVVCYGSDGGDITACAIATNACNVGTARASWISSTNQHPVIAQNAYRLMDDRFEQIGLSWVKHGFYAVSGTLCGPCEDRTDGTELGVGCSDPYSSMLNGIQTNMSPRSTVNANTGYFPYPWSAPGPDASIDRRLQIHNTDLDPALNPGARYFVQGHYVTPGDAAAGTHNNNASYREALAARLSPDELELRVLQTAQTQRGQPAVRAWKDVDDSVFETDIQIADEGLFILAAKAIHLGTGVWSYEYAVQNLNSDRSAMSFTVPLPDGAYVTNTGFHDVDYHSGDPYGAADWPDVVVDGSITWSTESYDTNENANALRWGTVYNFRFHVNAPPELTTITLGLFKPPPPKGEGPIEITGESLGPALGMIDCNGNEVADECDLWCAAPDCPEPCGASDDCDENGVPDECEPDCNGNDIPDVCDVAAGTSLDCNENILPDECEPDEDCNSNGIQDICDIAAGTAQDCDDNDIPDGCEPYEDCDGNGVRDICDIASGASDCNFNQIPDVCEPFTDCNDNFIRDFCDIAGGGSLDCNANGVPDECDPDEDCNTNEIQDICDIAAGTSLDCNNNDTPDECEPNEDCNGNTIQDVCDIAAGTSSDCNDNNTPDECEPYEDCNGNEVRDLCDIATGDSLDCNTDGIPDDCEITNEPADDCNSNDVLDVCEIDRSSVAPGGPFFCIVSCDPDCDDNGRPDECDSLSDTDGDQLLDCEDVCPLTNPMVVCACNDVEDCCFPMWCYSDINVSPIPPADCVANGGVPACSPSLLCRGGCLVGDVNDDGKIDLRDIAGQQVCFGIGAGENDGAECLRIFDYNGDGVIDLEDYEILEHLLSSGAL